MSDPQMLHFSRDFMPNVPLASTRSWTRRDAVSLNKSFAGGCSLWPRLRVCACRRTSSLRYLQFTVVGRAVWQVILMSKGVRIGPLSDVNACTSKRRDGEALSAPSLREYYDSDSESQRMPEVVAISGTRVLKPLRPLFVQENLRNSIACTLIAQKNAKSRSDVFRWIAQKVLEDPEMPTFGSSALFGSALGINPWTLNQHIS